MLKRLSMIMCALWCVFMVRMIFVVGKTAGKEELTEAFSQMILEDLQVHTELNGELQQVTNREEAVAFLREAMEMVSLGPDTPIFVETKENGMIWTAHGKLFSEEAEDVGAEITLSVMSIQDGFYTRYYFQAAANTHEANYEMSFIRPVFEKMKSKARMENIINTRYCASCGRLLTEQEKKQFEMGLLSYLSAELVSEFSENNLRMIYAYQRELGDAVLIDGEKVNLNIMMRDNSDETLCFVGVPIVPYDD